VKPLQITKVKSAIVLGTWKTLSTGISVKNLHNIVFCNSQKSFFSTNQAIGRGMRLHNNKTNVNIYDLIDDLSTYSYKNFMSFHFEQRLQFYRDEGFQIKEKEVNLA